MTFEEAQDMYDLYSISPELTCDCDDIHICQQCYEEYKNSKTNIMETYLNYKIVKSDYINNTYEAYSINDCDADVLISDTIEDIKFQIEEKVLDNIEWLNKRLAMLEAEKAEYRRALKGIVIKQS